MTAAVMASLLCCLASRAGNWAPKICVCILMLRPPSAEVQVYNHRATYEQYIARGVQEKGKKSFFSNLTMSASSASSLNPTTTKLCSTSTRPTASS
jgi:hypothetical protein